MSVNYEAKPINLNELKKNEESILLVEGDVIVPDRCPDIAKILLCDADASIMEKECFQGKINISGNVFLNILYLPENQDDEEKAKSINTKLDFSDAIPFGEENPMLYAKAEILSLNLRLINSRKVNVKAHVRCKVKAYIPCELSFYTPEKEYPLEIKKQSVSLHTTAVDVQKEFVFSETLSVPSAKCDIEEILKTNVNIIKGECDIKDEKILLRGSVNVATLYSGFYDGYTIECMEHELPFSEIIDVEGLSEDEFCNVTYDIKNVSVSCQNDENGDMRELVLNLTVNANITASRIYDVEILEDLYCPGKVCELKKEIKTLKKSVSEGTSRASFKNTFTLGENAPDILRVYSVSVSPVIKESAIAEGKLTLKGESRALILYSDASGALYSQDVIFPLEYETDIDSVAGGLICEYDISLLSSSYNILSEKEIEIRTNAEFFVRLTESTQLGIITDCTITEPEAVSSPRIIIYFVKAGDTLWDIAKRYNTTTARIKEINRIESGITQGDKILIPAR